MIKHIEKSKPKCTAHTPSTAFAISLYGIKSEHMAVKNVYFYFKRNFLSQATDNVTKALAIASYCPSVGILVIVTGLVLLYKSQ
jgi:hypothetical protein